MASPSNHLATSLELLQELQRRGRIARSIQPHGDGHELLSHGLVSRLQPDVGDVRSQPTWRRIGRDDRFRCGQTLRHELLCQLMGERIAEFLERLGRQFFHEQFDEKVLSCHYFFLSPSLTRPSSLAAPSAQPIRAGPWESPGAHDFQNSFAPQRAPSCGCGQCRQPARSR